MLLKLTRSIKTLMPPLITYFNLKDCKHHTYLLFTFYFVDIILLYTSYCALRIKAMAQSQCGVDKGAGVILISSYGRLPFGVSTQTRVNFMFYSGLRRVVVQIATRDLHD